MKVLALESANEQCSVSIVDENKELFFPIGYARKSTNANDSPND